MAIRYLSNTDDAENAGAWVVDDTIVAQNGETPITQNVAQDAFGANGLNRFLVRRDQKGDLGTSLDPMKFECSSIVSRKAMVENDGGRGVMYYDASGTANFCDLVRVIGLMDMVLQGSGEFTIAELYAAYTTIASSAVVPTLEVGGNARVLLSNTGAATRPVAITQDSGWLRTERGCNGTITAYGGVTEVDAGTDAITKLLVAGGSVKYVESGLPGTIEWRKGTLDVSALRRVIAPTNLDVWPGQIDADAWQLFNSSGSLVDLSSTVISEKARGEP